MQQAPWLAAGRYEVGEVVGRGGYGMVCRGVDRQTGQRVALKMLSAEAARDADLVERMLREQQALVALSGTCAVTVVDLCRLAGGAPCLVMEWLDGCDLEQQLSTWEAAGQFGSSELLLTILKPLTQTLERAHQIGLVHRDIKPANIFLTPDSAPGVRLLDFGLSRMKSAAPLTAFGVVMGSPSYIAPETWRGNSTALDGRADLFALAVITFRWLSGTLPFDAPDLIGKMTAVTSGPRPSIAPSRADLPAAVDAWFSRALAIEPIDRFQTGSELYGALEAALRGESWPRASADASGIRSAASAAPTTDASGRKSAFASAWGAAASLLKRFTGARERETPVATPPAASTPPAVTTPSASAVDEPPVSDRKSIWLDPEELQAAAPAPPPPPRRPRAAKPVEKTSARPHPKTKSKAKARPKNSKRTKAKPKPRRRKA